MSKITIQDVARVAGVSVATIDRVLNRRPGVKVTVTKVEGAIRDLNYQPDRIAARLARSQANTASGSSCPTTVGRLHAVASTRRSARGRRMAAERVTITWCARWTSLTVRCWPQVLDEMGDDMDGVAVVALDHPAVREAINALVARG
jgi:LacI family transcriptional regulator